MVAEFSLFEQITDIIAASSTPEELLKLKATKAEEIHYQELSLKFQNGQLTDEERSELSKFETIEHLVRMAKLRAMITLKKRA